MSVAYITGRLRRRFNDATEHESDVRDGAHGLLVWAGALVVGAIIAVGGIGAAATAVGNAVGTATMAASNVADEAKGLRSLRWADANLDGVIDSSDPVFEALRVWRDTNQDGIQDKDETSSLADLGITRIDYGNGRYTKGGTDHLIRSQELEADADGVQVSVVKGGIQINYASGKTPGVSGGARPEERVPMTRMRARIAERLMQSKNSIAMLTSFNEVNLGKVMAMRKELGESFEKANGIKLGFMSFFAKAAANALQRHPVVNASVDGNDVIYHGYADISIAVSTDKGLVTPVLRNVERMGFAEIEQAISDYAKRARDGKLGLDDLQGGTFTITNGGTFGSLMSTPIVNPPQSAILGMHAIKERAIVENGQVIAAPMMYIALSYDHRIIDGKDAVLFLVDIKNQLENPHRMLLGM